MQFFKNYILYIIAVLFIIKKLYINYYLNKQKERFN